MSDRTERWVCFVFMSCIAAFVLVLLRAYFVRLIPDMMIELRIAGWLFAAAVEIWVALWCVEV